MSYFVLRVLSMSESYSTSKLYTDLVWFQFFPTGSLGACIRSLVLDYNAGLFATAAEEALRDMTSDLGSSFCL